MKRNRKTKDISSNKSTPNLVGKTSTENQETESIERLPDNNIQVDQPADSTFNEEKKEQMRESTNDSFERSNEMNEHDAENKPLAVMLIRIHGHLKDKLAEMHLQEITCGEFCEAEGFEVADVIREEKNYQPCAFTLSPYCARFHMVLKNM